MHITDYLTLVSLTKGTKIWVIETPKLDMYSNLFTFNLTANITRFYPFNIFEKNNDDGMRFKKVDLDKKTCYDFSMDDVYVDLREYDKLHTHNFIVATSEREIIKLFKDSIIEFEETAKRMLSTVNRFKNDTFKSKLIEEHYIQFPEDWI